MKTNHQLVHACMARYIARRKRRDRLMIYFALAATIAASAVGGAFGAPAEPTSLAQELAIEVGQYGVYKP